MSENWGATGVLEIFSHRLSEIAKSSIEKEIRSNKIEPKNGYDELFHEIEQAISRYKGHKKLAQDSSPSKIRKNLRNALNLALKLNESLNSLDGNSRKLLDQGNGISILYRHLSVIISDLIKAQESADNYPKSGRNPVNERIVLVLELDNILSERIDCHLTTTKVSLFYNLLTLVYQEATGRADVKNVGDLLQDAKKWLRIVHPGGVIEYRPQDTD